MIDRSHSASLTPAQAPAERPIAPGASRLVSLAISIAAMLTLAVYPGVVLRGDAQLTHALMPVLMIAIGACLAHGIGWRPRSSILAAAAGPFVAWPLTLATFVFLAFGA